MLHTTPVIERPEADFHPETASATGAPASAIVEAKPSTSRLPHWLQLPMGVSWKRVRWGVTLSILAVHLIALLAALPWLFSWTGMAMSLVGIYIFGTLGINICYHRLLTHRSFKTPQWFERFLALLAMCSLEGSPISWVANHRMHHQHSDKEPDPHSPVVAFLWSHIGWMLVENRDVNCHETYARYAGDLCRDKFYFTMTKHSRWLLVYAVHVALFFLAGFSLGSALESVALGVQLGLSWVIWGVFVRTILVWHITWSVNSITHLAGYRNYETNENSRNNWLVGIVAMGEGWHNNHHADQRSAAHGHRWWEIDLTYATILLFQQVGLATNIVKPKKKPTGRKPMPVPPD